MVQRFSAIPAAAAHLTRPAGTPLSEEVASLWPLMHGTHRKPRHRRGHRRPHPLDERRPGLRRRLGRADRRHPAEHRGDRPRRAARAAQGRRALAADRLRVRPRTAPTTSSSGGQGRPRRAGAVRPGRRGLDPERGDQAGGLLVRLRQQPGHRPADDDQRVARPAGAQGDGRSWPSAPAPPTAASTPWPATRPARWACRTTSAGTGSRRPACRSSACPAARSTRTTSPRRSSTCSTRSPGQAPMIPLDEALRPHWLFGATVHEGCDRGGYYEQGDFATEYGSPKCLVKLGCWGPVREVQRAQARLDQRRRRLPERRRHLHRLHDARLPGQVHAVHGRAARRQGVDHGQHAVRDA